MDTGALKKFAQAARRQLKEQVATKLEQVLKTDSAALREKENAVKELQKQIAQTSRESVIDRVAYIWFNRFCALRFMDNNRYTRIGTVSPAEGFTPPELLQEAKQGHIDKTFTVDSHKVFDLLSGRSPSPDPQQEAYRLLLVAVCNYYNSIMPFMFEKIADYTELLMPDDLLSESSILHAVRKAMTPDACKDVEIIGWLYQFYISEKKDEVFEQLKKGKKITPENIPAATQLFTPHWIVQYLVENSLGRLWMLNRPDSRLAEKMDFYIEPEQQETDFLCIPSPEEIKICDPACGSGHMLVYAFDLLYAIYEEEGYDAPNIPRLILENNLYGIEIDERAGELAAFALFMKAREKYRRFFHKPVQPNICVLENIKLEDREIERYMDEVGHNLFTYNLQTTLHQFEEAKNFGSLIQPAVKNVANILRILEEKRVGENLFLYMTHQRVLKVLRQADYLSPKYHVVIANPPYMGGKGMNPRLNSFAKDNYQNSKLDLFAMFIERNLDLAIKQGFVAMITMQSWMFLSSFERFRGNIFNSNTVLSMAHLGARAFDSIGGEVVSTTAFVIKHAQHLEYKGSYLRLVDGNCENDKEKELKAKRSDTFRASISDFKKIPGSPIAYWVSNAFRQAFITGECLGSLAEPKSGLSTTANDRFLRYWQEIQFDKIGFGLDDIDETNNHITKWFPFNKGGDFRKWYGNNEYVVNWQKNGEEIRKKTKGAAGGRIVSPEYYFKYGITWSGISSSKPSMRILQNSIFGSGGKALFSSDNLFYYLALLNSKVAFECLSVLSPTLNYEAGHIGNIPIIFAEFKKSKIKEVVENNISVSKQDWDFYETSWDFANLPLLQDKFRRETLEDTYTALRTQWQEMTLEMKHLEEENNRIFIDAYGLQDELKPDVPMEEITLTCNPRYRYDNKKSDEELETLLLADTMKEFISYAVGCMFGRYSLDKPGLILANQGETLEDYLRQILEPTFQPDDDNVIPFMDVDWFTDDIAERFRKFLRITFGEEHYEENLAFIEKAIGKDIRKYFLRDFYNDHVKRYKKRPIYWMFSSPKGSFNALIYIHRYRPDTVSVVLNDYLREFRTKITARKNHLEHISISTSASQSEKTKALKEIEKLKNIINELENWERDIIYPLATQQIEIDLDDGVKVNYAKFGSALKKIPGLN